MKHWRLFLCVILLSMVSCNSQKNLPQSTPGGQASGECGDGILDPLEQANPSLCPQDSSVQPTMSLPEDNVPPLYFFYVIHVHIANGDTAPYADPGMTQLVSNVANNMIATIEGIAEVLDRHGAKGTWEVVYGTSKGLCAYQGQNHIFRQLSERGHEIGAHVHRKQDIQPAYDNLHNTCAIPPATISGFLVTFGTGNPILAQPVFSEDISISTNLGMTVGTGNLSPSDKTNPFGLLCNNQIGIDNDMWLQTGNLLFPWMPDYRNENICNSDPLSDFVMLDHVSPTWMMAGQAEMPDVLSEKQFDYLQQDLDGALTYMEANRPAHVAAWGFVTHIIEYAPGSHGENPPEPAALAALDAFLDYVDSRAAEGRIIYATASQIADAVFQNR